MRLLYYICSGIITLSLGVGLLAHPDSRQAGQAVLSAQEYPNPSPFPLRNPGVIDPAVNARRAILLDAGSFYPLYKKDAYESVPIASTTKMMTALVALERHQFSQEITISKKAALQIGSTAGLVPGEVLTVESLLQALLIQSGNDAAYALAEENGSIDSFVTRMNEKAKEMGLRSTQFMDPAGLDDAGKSSAFDLAILGVALMNDPRIQQITQKAETAIYSTDGVHEHRLKNSNRLVTEEMHLQGAIGIKTGFTPQAGHALVAAAIRDQHMLVAVILSTYEDSKDASARESKKLLQWGFDNFSWAESE